MTPRFLKICLLAGLILLGPPGTSGQELDEEPPDDGLIDEFAFLQEEDIIFSAAKHEQEIGESPSAITVITREQIENSACTDVICLLREVPEMDVKRIYPMYPAVGARALTGETGDKILLLVDGMEVNEELWGMPYWQALPVHLEEIERIEVIRGPGSALYGANAHSGIVSITTRRTEATGAEVFIGSGEHGRSSLYLGAGWRISPAWSLHLSSGLDFQDHWRIRDQHDRRIYHLSLRLARRTDDSTTLLYAGLISPEGRVYARLGTISFAEPGLLSNVLLSHRTDWLKAQVYLKTYDASMGIKIPLYFQGSELGRLPPDAEVFSSSLDAEVQINWSPLQDNLLIGGANYRWLTFFNERNVPDEEHQHRVGFFLQDEQRLLDALILTGGLRFDYNTVSGVALSPRLAAVWKLVADQHLRAAFGTAFRKPSILNSTIRFKGVKGIAGIGEFFERSIGNPDLGNENVTSLELGYIGRFFEKRLTAETSFFYNRFRDTISFYSSIAVNEMGVPDLRLSELEFRNEGMDVDTLGGSVSFTFAIRETLRVNVNYTYRYSWYVSDPKEGSATPVEKKGERVPWERAHMFNASLYYLSRKGLHLGFAAHAASSAQEPWTEGGSPFGDSILIDNPAFAFFNAFLAWRWSAGPNYFEAGVRVFNVFNTAVREHPAVRQPDGTELGGQLIGRRVFLYLRAGI